MADQLSFDQWHPEGTIQEHFEQFHRTHPEVYHALVTYTRDARRAGRERIGVRMIWERMRWYLAIERDATEDYKFNDHYPSRYARLIMDQEPDLAGVFETRRLRRA